MTGGRSMRPEMKHPQRKMTEVRLLLRSDP